MSDLEKDSVDAGEVLQPVSSKEKKLRELERRRETKEISPHDFDLNFIFSLNELAVLDGRPYPLQRSNLDHATGVQAVVLRREDLEQLRFLDYIDSSGNGQLLLPGKFGEDDVCILYPEDLGNRVDPLP